MNSTDQLPPVPEPLPSPEAKPPAMSLPARLLNVFAIPGDVFEEVKATPATAANWLVPILISAIVGIIATCVIFSQPAIIQQLHDQQASMYDSLVKAGKMSQADADKALAAIAKFSNPTLLKISGSVGAIIGSFVQVCGWALVLWVLGIFFLKVRFGYSRALEIAGLAGMVSVLGGIVMVLLTVSMGKVTAPNLAVLLSHYDENNSLHRFMAATNVFTIWWIALMSVGLARLTNVRFPRALFGVMGCWLAMQMFLIFVVTALLGLLKLR